MVKVAPSNALAKGGINMITFVNGGGAVALLISNNAGTAKMGGAC